jgi:crotonobetainyl-CoA dehydrogenase
MDFKLSDEQELLLDSIREFVTNNFPESYWQDCDQNHRPPYEFMKAYADLGFQMLGLPEDVGGTPVDAVTMALVKIELGRLGVPVFGILTGVNPLQMIREYGTREQLAYCVDRLKSGKHIGAMASTEPQSGSNAAGIETKYTRSNGKVYINGSKTFITNAIECDYMLVIARNPKPENPKKVFTAWWVPTKAPGVKMELMGKIGQNYTNTCAVYLDNVEVEEAAMIGPEGDAFVMLMKCFELERINMSANALGPAIAAFEDAARYANQRTQFDKKIGDFQQIQLKLVSMKSKIENMKHMVLKSAWMADEGQSIKSQAALCKLYCVQSAFEVIDDAMQIMGGIGYMSDHRISRFWRDARFFRFGGGTDEIMVNIVGKEILKEYVI